MSTYRRYFVPGGTYFFTLVTYERHPFFRSRIARGFLGDAIRLAQTILPFDIPAIVLMPDHLHCERAILRDKVSGMALVKTGSDS